MFQSTPPHGGRHPAVCPMLLYCSFNPRPRTGGDMFNDCYLYAKADGLFQSTPPHGGRQASAFV